MTASTFRSDATPPRPVDGRKNRRTFGAVKRGALTWRTLRSSEPLPPPATRPPDSGIRLAGWPPRPGGRRGARGISRVDRCVSSHRPAHPEADRIPPAALQEPASAPRERDVFAPRWRSVSVPGSHRPILSQTSSVVSPKWVGKKFGAFIQKRRKTHGRPCKNHSANAWDETPDGEKL